jgi:proline dehydrogenase
VTALLRAIFLWLGANRAARRLASRFGMRLGASRFVAGGTLDEAVPRLRALNRRGLQTTAALLGESVRDRAATEADAAAIIALVDRLAAEGLSANVSIKPTHLGLDIDEDLAFANLSRITAHAAERGAFVRIDMEDSPRVDATLRLYRRLRGEGHENVGTVLQSCLFRTADDYRALADLKPNLRLVKGAYAEPPTVAYADKADVDAAFVRLAETMLRGPGYTAIATHDARIVEHLRAFAEREGIGRDRFEFQLLYGVRGRLQIELAAAGYTTRVYTPYGTDWYPYFMRRLAERPANVRFVLQQLFRR